MYSFCSSRNPDNERLLKKQCLRRPITVTTCYRGFRDEPKERLRKRMLHIGHKLNFSQPNWTTTFKCLLEMQEPTCLSN